MHGHTAVCCPDLAHVLHTLDNLAQSPPLHAGVQHWAMTKVPPVR